MTDQFSQLDFAKGVADAAVLLEQTITTSTTTTTTSNNHESISHVKYQKESDAIDNRVVNYTRRPTSPTKSNSSPISILVQQSQEKHEKTHRQRIQIDQGQGQGQETKILEEVENVKEEEKEKEEISVEAPPLEIDPVEIPMKIPVCPNSHSEGRTLINTVFPTDVDSLFTWIFTDSKFFNDLHKSRKTFDMMQSDWPEVPEGSQNMRKITFTITLNQSVGPKNSCITETQVMNSVSRAGQIYVIDVDSVNAKPTPYADSFSIFSHFCMTRISANETKLVVVNQIKYMKSVSFVVKPFIEKNSWAGLEDFYTCLEKALRLECSKASKPTSLKKLSLNSTAHARLRRMNADANSRRKPKISRTKRPAPEPPTATPSPTSANQTPNRGSKFSFSFFQKAGSELTSSGGRGRMKHVKIALLLLVLALIFLNLFLYLKLQRLEAIRNSNSDGHFDTGYEIKDRQIALQWLTEKLEEAEINYQIQLEKWKKAIETTAGSFHKWGEGQKNLELDLDLINYAKDEVESRPSRWTEWE